MTDQLPPDQQPAAPAEAPKAAPAKDADRNKIMAALAYFGILFLVPLFLAKDDEFVQFHVKQGIIWFLVWVVISFIWWIPVIGWLAGVALLAISIFGAVQAFEGRRWEMPYVSKYAKQIKL